MENSEDSVTKRNSKSDWIEFESLSNARDDYTVSYFVTDPPGAPAVTQADRDYIERVMAYFSRRGKRLSCPATATVTAELPMDVQGLTTNRTANNPLDFIFRASKHIRAMCKYISETRIDNNNIVLHISVDGSPFYPIN